MSSLHPKFYFIHQIIRIFCLILIFLLFSVLAILMFYEILKTLMSTSYGAFFGATFLFLLIALVVAFLASYFIKFFYKHSQFKILKDRVEYCSDYFGLRIKDLKFKNVKEMSLIQGILQKRFGLGTIYLLSHASPQNSKSTGSGLKIYNIRDSKKIYDLLKKEVDKAEV